MRLLAINPPAPTTRTCALESQSMSSFEGMLLAISSAKIGWIVMLENESCRRLRSC